MGYHSLTPFGRTERTVRTALENHRPRAQTPGTQAPCPIDKWQILRDLTAGRTRFGLSDRDITVLQALLSCHPDTRLDASAPLIVHPSNETICARANGMACSTMRRHLAKLVAEGFLLRRDSPNGKRYARRIAGAKIAFGFDLSPLLHRAAEIAEAAESCRVEAAELASRRQTVSLLRRDLSALVELAGLEGIDAPALPRLSDLSQAVAAQLRRKLNLETLAAIELSLRDAIRETARLLDLSSTISSNTDARNEQHQQKTNKDLIDLEPAQTSERIETPPPAREAANLAPDAKKTSPSLPPLRLVLRACTEVGVYAPDPIADWHGFMRAADKIRPMTGISPAVWDEAKGILGKEQAATVLGAMLQRFSAIRNPGGYLRSLVTKARGGAFSPMRMIMALLPDPV
ncbi:replication initiation protein RepC [Limimaricola sp. ASW11-118]|uniref:Replication initiation protein RepC n=1 Tax=Limimaricola litoreus TaxID=2955316 RepID=A0A9X2FNN6_9RHOB|nr:plasmid replication protein RepC [Limimaricola litoreus]MCP1168356.1 replication initiation protein RepC [Limimaricola litoreus]